MHRRGSARPGGKAGSRLKAQGGSRDAAGGEQVQLKLLLPAELLDHHQGADAAEGLVVVPANVAVLRQHAKHARHQRLLPASQRSPLDLEPSRYSLENLPPGFLPAAKFIVIGGLQPDRAAKVEAKALAAERLARKGLAQAGGSEGLEVPVCVVPSLGILRKTAPEQQPRPSPPAQVKVAQAAVDSDEGSPSTLAGMGTSSNSRVDLTSAAGTGDGRGSPAGQATSMAAAVVAQAPVRRMGGKEGRLMAGPGAKPSLTNGVLPQHAGDLPGRAGDGAEFPGKEHAGNLLGGISGHASPRGLPHPSPSHSTASEGGESPQGRQLQGVGGTKAVCTEARSQGYGEPGGTGACASAAEAATTPSDDDSDLLVSPNQLLYSATLHEAHSMLLSSGGDGGGAEEPAPTAAAAGGHQGRGSGLVQRKGPEPCGVSALIDLMDVDVGLQGMRPHANGLSSPTAWTPSRSQVHQAHEVLWRNGSQLLETSRVFCSPCSSPSYAALHLHHSSPYHHASPQPSRQRPYPYNLPQQHQQHLHQQHPPPQHQQQPPPQYHHFVDQQHYHHLHHHHVQQQQQQRNHHFFDQQQLQEQPQQLQQQQHHHSQSYQQWLPGQHLPHKDTPWAHASPQQPKYSTPLGPHPPHAPATHPAPWGVQHAYTAQPMHQPHHGPPASMLDPRSEAFGNRPSGPSPGQAGARLFAAQPPAAPVLWRSLQQQPHPDWQLGATGTAADTAQGQEYTQVQAQAQAQVQAHEQAARGEAVPDALRPWAAAEGAGDARLAELTRLTCSMRAATAAVATREAPGEELHQVLSAALPFLAARGVPVRLLEASGVADATLQAAKALKEADAAAAATTAAAGAVPQSLGSAGTGAAGTGVPASPRLPFSPLGLGPPSPVVLGSRRPGAGALGSPAVTEVVNYARALWGSWGQSLASAVLEDEASPPASAPTHPKIHFYFSHQALGAPDSGSDDGPGPQGSAWHESCDRRPWGLRQGQRGNAAAGYAVPVAEANGGPAAGRGAESAVNGTVPAGGRAHWVRAGAGRAGASMAAAAAGLAAGYAGGKGQEANGRTKQVMPRPVVTPLNVSVSGGPEVTPVLTQKRQEQRAAAAAQRLDSLGSRSISNAHESDRVVEAKACATSRCTSSVTSLSNSRRPRRSSSTEVKHSVGADAHQGLGFEGGADSQDTETDSAGLAQERDSDDEFVLGRKRKQRSSCARKQGARKKQRSKQGLSQ